MCFNIQAKVGCSAFTDMELKQALDQLDAAGMVMIVDDNIIRI